MGCLVLRIVSTFSALGNMPYYLPMIMVYSAK